MVLLIVVVTIIVFVLVDFLLRVYFQKRQELKLRKEREAALDIGLKLDYSEEAKTLKASRSKEPQSKNTGGRRRVDYPGQLQKDPRRRGL